MKITNPYGPNTTVLLPGSCNAACDFCFWDRDLAKIDVPDNYLDKVFRNIASLPEDFRVLSISGGEPTLSPWFGRFLTRLGQYRRQHELDRVVLTTHGGNLYNFVTAVGCVVDHINISRHAIGTEANYEVFKTKKIPTDQELITLIRKIHHETACDVTFNCVVPPDVTEEFCYAFIEYAKSLGADAVSFRKVASNATATNTEKRFAKRHGVLGESKCQVCRGMSQRIDGFDVRWKGSVPEPSIETNGVYEVIIHPDGDAYTDWAMTVPLEPILQKAAFAEIEKSLSANTFVSSCGSGSYGCGNSATYIPPKQTKQVKPKVVHKVQPIQSGCGSSGCGSSSSYVSGCGSSGCGR